MADAPKLTIGVPSRNRQRYFQQTIVDLVSSPRQDLQFVFVDNSDDPSIMNDFMGGIDDPRVTFIPSSSETHPMQDNWERLAQAAKGDWVSIIGDDDYLDPELAGVIGTLEQVYPDIDGIGWSRLNFKWPDFRPYPGNFPLSLSNVVGPMTVTQLQRAMFLWEGAANLPAVPFGVYHAAVPRRMMLRIRDRFSGRFFEHPTVDFDFCFKLITTGSRFAYISRPLSVFGSTSVSNSGAVGSFRKIRENYGTFLAEKGRDFEDVEFMTGFPFRADLGVTASIGWAQEWFKRKYGFIFPGWEEGFVKALAEDCSRANEREEFDLHCAALREILCHWQGGRHLPLFAPQFKGHGAGQVFTGYYADTLRVHENIGGCVTPAGLYRIAEAIISPLNDLDLSLLRNAPIAA